MEMSKVTVLICGQVRHPEILELSLRAFEQMRQAGLVHSIVISSWTDDARAIVEIVQGLGMRDGIELMVANPPKMYSAGNFLPQMTLLYNGLLEVDSDAVVLKYRPDVLVDYGKLAMAIGEYVTHPQPAEMFEAKVWVPYFEASQPFCIGDVMYMGRRNDLMKLCNFDIRHDARTPIFNNPDVNISIQSGGTEIRTFMPHFLARYPVLNEYDQIWYLAGYDMPWRKKLLDFNYDSPLYWEYFGAFFHALQKNFIVGAPLYDGYIGIVREIVDHVPTVVTNQFPNTVDPTVFGSNFVEQNEAHQTFCNQQAWVDNIAAGTITDIAVVEDVLAGGIERALAYACTPDRRGRFREYRMAIEAIVAANGA